MNTPYIKLTDKLSYRYIRGRKIIKVIGNITTRSLEILVEKGYIVVFSK